MLSYRHSFHAGNFADVIKHIVLVEALEHFTRKDKPFDYIDTHAGAGLFNLESSHALKLAEHANGIGKLEAGQFPELSRYFETIAACNSSNRLRYYPGSPLIASQFLRRKDNAWLYELHKDDADRLRKNTEGNRRIKVICQDGLKGVLAHLPPISRRALVLIDPSYEIKSDYEQVFKTVQSAHKRFATGTYGVWYPVVDRKRIAQLETSFIHSGIKNIQRFELGLCADTDGSGMTSSGMIVVNPPWGLFDKMSRLLPRLVEVLGTDKGAFFKCDQLVSE
ncbi:23S rRNA (adenine(2030)-N(6))-methyltransferase RlmJ [Aestuariirhabdus sp. LZHN29]|uniref:23S rRNA (adenine(2030)-N(6))-methyltransferase RlmJ n=1 Tax=Aestuariirhabdus sp. LZHN29 TaxID=3417462 RepID=UPI003CF64FFD